MGASESLGTFVSLIRGTTYKGVLVGSPGPALLGLGSITPGGGFREGDFKTYGGDCPEKLLLGPGDLFVSLKGATKDGEMIGSIARVPTAVPSGRLTQDTVKLDFKSGSTAFRSYIYWLLRTPHYRQYCAARATGSAVVALSRDDFLAYAVPPLDTARGALVTLFDAVEEKIRLNRRMCQTLEEMARALFKSWFVDFDPVRAKMEGRNPGLPKEIADLFPSRLVDSELGPIPEGWSAKPLDEVADFLNGLALQKYPPQDGFATLPALKIAQLKRADTSGADRCSAEVPAPYRVVDGDLIFSWSGSLEVAIWTGGAAALNQHLFKVTSDRFPSWCLYQWVCQHLPEFRQIAADKATTMGHIQRRHLSAARVAVPSDAVRRVADSIFGPMTDRILATRIESRTLAALRDTLLPKLISGELRVPPSLGSMQEVST